MGRPALDPEERARRKRERDRRYYQEHRDEKREWQRQYYESHKEHIRKYRKKWRSEHRDYFNEKSREYYRTYSQQDGYKEKRALRYAAEKRRMIADMMGV